MADYHGKVIKLLAKADDPAASPAEAEAYKDKARELAGRHGITLPLTRPVPPRMGAAWIGGLDDLFAWTPAPEPPPTPARRRPARQRATQGNAATDTPRPPKRAPQRTVARRISPEIMQMAMAGQQVPASLIDGVRPRAGYCDWCKRPAWKSPCPQCAAQELAEPRTAWW